MSAIFFGLKAAVLAVVSEAVVRIGRSGLKTPIMRSLAAAAFIAILFFAVPFPIVIIAAGLSGYIGARIGNPAFAGLAHEAASEDSDSLLGSDLTSHTLPSAA